MTVTTVYVNASGDDARVRSANATYATARTGASLALSATGTSITVGEQFFSSTYYIYEGLYRFDTSTVPDTDVVSSVTLSAYLFTSDSTYTYELREHNWGPTAETTDWVAGENLSSLPLVSTQTIGTPTGAYKTFPTSANFTALSGLKTGYVHLLMHGQNHRLGTAPTGVDLNALYAYDNGSNIPYLTITHAAAPVSGTAACSLAITATASGTRTVTSTAAMSSSLAGSALGVVIRPAHAVSNFTVSATGVGVRTTAGTAEATLGDLTATASGIRSTSGAIATDLTFAATASGTRVVVGQTIMTGQLDAQATGLRVVIGASMASLSITATISGSVTVVGSASVPGDFTATLTGTRTTFGQMAFDATITATGQGSAIADGYGVAAASLQLVATVSGRPIKPLAPLVETVTIAFGDPTDTRQLASTTADVQLGDNIGTSQARMIREAA